MKLIHVKKVIVNLDKVISIEINEGNIRLSDKKLFTTLDITTDERVIDGASIATVGYTNRVIKIPCDSFEEANSILVKIMEGGRS